MLMLVMDKKRKKSVIERAKYKIPFLRTKRSTAAVPSSTSPTDTNTNGALTALLPTTTTVALWFRAAAIAVEQDRVFLSYQHLGDAFRDVDQHFRCVVVLIGTKILLHKNMISYEYVRRHQPMPTTVVVVVAIAPPPRNPAELTIYPPCYVSTKSPSCSHP